MLGALWIKMIVLVMTEMSIGNIVRRVLHMIREEMQEEVEEGTSRTAAETAVKEQVVPGLLSKAFSRQHTVSLHNLLDRPVRSYLPRDSSPQTLARDSASIASPDEDVPDHADLARRRAQKSGWSGKPSIIEQINELIEELVDIESNIALHAVDYIHANEVILTFGYSYTTLLFLTEAAKKRNFQVVVAEGAPEYGGHKMARELARAGIVTTAICDSATFAMMARVNKVLVGAHAIMADGGIVARVGALLVALAAKRFCVPFVVLAGLHKLCPVFADESHFFMFNDTRSPSGIINYGVMSKTMEAGAELAGDHEAKADSLDCNKVYVQAINPLLEYVSPDLVSLFVTDTGGFTPSYVYRMLAEYYSREDFVLVSSLSPNFGLSFR
eukprot:jgi/Botrbrau1/1171/Bobra.0162s0058.2